MTSKRTKGVWIGLAATIGLIVLAGNVFLYFHAFFFTEEHYGDDAESIYKPDRETYVILSCSPPWSTASSVRARSYHFAFLAPLNAAIWARKHNVTPAFVLVGDRWKIDPMLDTILVALKKFAPNSIIYHVPTNPKVPDATLAQVTRIYAAHLLKDRAKNDSFVITSDIDLFLNRMKPWSMLDFENYDVLLTNSECCEPDYAIAHISMRLRDWMKYFPIYGHKQDPVKNYSNDTRPFGDGVSQAILKFRNVDIIKDTDRVGAAWGTDQEMVGKVAKTFPLELKVRKLIWDSRKWDRIWRQPITNPKRILDLHDFSEYPSYSYKNIHRTLECFLVVFESNEVLHKEMIKLSYEYYSNFITTILNQGQMELLDLVNVDAGLPR